MSTWYSTCINFYSKSRRSIEEFKQKLDSIYGGKATQPNKFGKGWIGDIANTFYPSLGADKIDSLGTFTVSDDVCKRDEWFYFSIWTWSARGIKVGLFYKLITDFYPEIKISYVSDGLVYLMWDEGNLFYPFKYYMDMYYPSKTGEVCQIDTHEFASMEEIYEWLDEHFPFELTRTKSLSELESQIQERLEESDSDNFYCELEEYAEMAPKEFEIFYDYV
mgnify:CR=1 FL=1